jgi:hypothetical protein
LRHCILLITTGQGLLRHVSTQLIKQRSMLWREHFWLP